MTTRRASSKPIFKRRASGNLLANMLLGVCVIIASIILSSHRNVDNTAPVLNPVVTDFDTIAIMVPSEPVAAGTKVKDIRFKTVSYPKHQIPSGALDSFEQFSDSVVVAPLPANLPLFRENLSEIGHIANPVLEKIPLGMRAMTVRVDATSAVEGWAGSGSVVDILLIEKDRTSVVAEKVKVLSAERSVAPIEGQASPTVPSTVTLLVTQEQCLAINTAIPLGKIAFALRSSRDEEIWQDKDFSSEDLITRQDIAEEKSGDVQGVVSFKGEDSQRSFALTDGKWIKTESVPQGFFVGAN